MHKHLCISDKALGTNTNTISSLPWRSFQFSEKVDMQ
jgi:hypothetical protein